jgi:lipopolysaccharide/colanic/teichoic acid biosynthesis glycosyltransferase
LNAEQHVVSIRRNFRKRRHARPRPALLGIAWRLDANPLQSPLAGHPWRTVRALLRQSKFGVVRYVVERGDAPPVAPHEFRSQLVNQLAPASLRALADDLGFKPVADFCFAHPTAGIDPQAVLRGPLFIDPGVAMTAHHIHVGPDWITAESPAVTWPADPPEPQQPRHAPVPRGSYFDGPRTGHQPVYEFCKRVFDIVFSLFALAVTLPVCVAVAVLIKLYDRGPVFFAHTRETVHGKPFGCLKFRTMVRNAEAMKKELRQQNQVDGPQFKIVKDPRITPIGRFLRKTNIDELPQFLNVLRGDMSVVGPRPSPFEENQLCPAWREARLSVKPGITGLWQISRSPERGAADFQEWILYDTQYVERRSFSLDMRILLLTIKELFGQGQ